MVVLSLCFSMLSIRAWDRLTVNRSKDKYKDAIYTCMGQTKVFYNNNNQLKKPHLNQVWLKFFYNSSFKISYFFFSSSLS